MLATSVTGQQWNELLDTRHTRWYADYEQHWTRIGPCDTCNTHRAVAIVKWDTHETESAMGDEYAREEQEQHIAFLCGYCLEPKLDSVATERLSAKTVIEVGVNRWFLYLTEVPDGVVSRFGEYPMGVGE